MSLGTPFRPAIAFAAGLTLLSLFGCMTAYKKSVNSETSRNFSRIFIIDYNTAWQSVLDALKNSALDVSNREGGFLQTRWTDNTSEKNFTDAFGNADLYLKAQYRFKVTVAKGFHDGQPSVKISIQKDQLVQRDVLEGWRSIETDSIDENTLLYRIGRLIQMRVRLSELEEERTKKELEGTEL